MAECGKTGKAGKHVRLGACCRGVASAGLLDPQKLVDARRAGVAHLAKGSEALLVAAGDGAGIGEAPVLLAARR